MATFTFDRAKFKAQGYTDEEIDKFLETERAQGKQIEILAEAPAPTQQSQASPPRQGRSLLAGALPILGGIAGGILGAPLGPAGIIAGGAIGSGLGEGAAQATSGEKFDPGKVVGETAMGGVGGVAGLGIGRILGVGARAAAGAGKGIQKSIINPKTVASVFGAGEDEQIVKTAIKRLGGGSGANQYKNLEPAFKQLDDEIVPKLTGKTVETTKVLGGFDDALENTTNFDDTIPAFSKAKDKFVNQLLGKASKGETGLEITDKSLYEFKKSLNKQLGRAFDKIEKANPLTPQEEVAVAMWGTIDDLMPKGVNALMKEQSYLIKAATGLQQSANKQLRLPVVGNIPFVMGGAQSVGGKAGQVLAKADGLSPNLSRVLTQGAGQSTSRALLSPAPPPIDTAAPPSALAETGVIPSMQQAERTVQIQGKEVTESQLRQAYIDSLAAGQKDNAALIEKVLKAAFPEGDKKPLAVSGANAKSLAESGVRGLQEAAALFQQDPSLLTKQLLPGKFASRQFDSALFRAVEALLRARSGAAVPEQEVKRYMTKYAPTFGDSPEVAAYKFQQLEEDFMSILNNIDATRGGTTLESLTGSAQSF